MSTSRAAACQNDLKAALERARDLEARGDLPAAERCYRDLLASAPAHHGAWHNLSLLAIRRGQLPLAVGYLEKAVSIEQNVAMYWRNLGEMYRRQGVLAKAIAAGARAVALDKNDVHAHYNLGLAHADAGQYEAAVRHYEHALTLDPHHGLACNNLGSALERLGQRERALQAYRRAIAIDARHAEAQNNLGALLMEAGDLPGAQAAFASAIGARPHFIEAHYNQSSLKTYRQSDPDLEHLRTLYAQRERLSEEQRIRLTFAYGKVLDDLCDCDAAFAAFAEGNRLQQRRAPFDEVRADATLAQTLATFDAAFFAARRHWRGAMDARRTPVFIVGMPRSGTTLLEQILSSHPALHGAGELESFDAALGGGQDIAVRAIGWNELEVRRVGERYLDAVWQRSPESTFIADKMPANFFHLGLIHLALPGAKIIHVMRDPLDSCLSCYTRLFSDRSMAFTYDLGSLGRYYGRYARLMERWHAVLPPGSVLDVAYETLVQDTASEVRRILQFVGLPWDERCLAFHENARIVQTASQWQVRKPIYTSSIARSRRYAQHLDPLREALQQGSGPALAPWQPAPASESVLVSARSADEHHAEAVSLYRQGRLTEALERHDRATALHPDSAVFLNTRGFILQDMNRLQEARACFERALALDASCALAQLNLGMLQLKLGDWEAGWRNYEARWTGSAEANQGTLGRIVCPLPHWEGEPVAPEQRLLVITEQGFGDCFQFARYLPLAKLRFAKVGILCSQPTQRLLEWTWGESITTLAHLPADFAGWDLQCSLLSLPRVFGTRPETIPADVPYLRANANAVDYWRERVAAAAEGRLRVGIAWTGRRAHQANARRSVPFELLTELLADPRIAWFSLQKRGHEDDTPRVPAGTQWIDWTAELDFADTAALILNLDLVISVDSVMAHLTGALNKPIWLLNRFDGEWRWFAQRVDSPWYPSMRIFNQPRYGDWPSVLREVEAALRSIPIPSTLFVPARALPATQPTSSVDASVMSLPAAQENLLPRAAQLHATGRVAEARQIVESVLRREPNNAHAVHLRGLTQWSGGERAAAIASVRQAIALREHALFHSNLGEMLRQRRELDAAIEQGLRAVALDPTMAMAHANLGVAYYDREDYERAAACHRQALVLAPGLAVSLNTLGSIARAEKNPKAALAWYRQAVAAQPQFIDALSNLSAMLLEEDEVEEAERVALRALELYADCAPALCNLGLVRVKQERYDEAQRLLGRALELQPGYSEALVGLAIVKRECEQPEAALTLLAQALQGGAKGVTPWCVLASVHMENANPREAQVAFETALAIDPAASGALSGLGHLRLEQGKLEEAERLFEQAIAVDATHLGARFHLTQARKVTADDANLHALEALLPTATRLSGEKQISLHYALGKSYDDLKQWDRAFTHFLTGAKRKRATLIYDADADASRVLRLIEQTSRARLAELKGGGHRSEVPVFILGMPRSGTTLTEQIIASHPEVHGAGELRDLMQSLQEELTGASFPESLARLSPERLSRWGARYTQRLRRHAPGAARITDKMPGNYLLLGLISLALPDAKIIHVRRNPIDTCVSCFTRLFNRHQEATYDLRELGRHYASYARLMQHWRSVMPPDAFMEVHYEDIVADMEGQARRLVDWVGLPWADACLEFHKTERSVRTASVAQVRQPIYTHSVERWRHYERHLGPLFEGLAEFAPPGMNR